MASKVSSDELWQGVISIAQSKDEANPSLGHGLVSVDLVLVLIVVLLQ